MHHETMRPGAPVMETTALQTFGMRPAVSAVPSRQESNLLDLLIILSRHQQIILRTTLAAALLTALGSLLLPNRYNATTAILPPQQSPSLAASMIGQLGALGPMAAMAQKDLGLKNPSDLYVGMLRSRTSEDALIRRFDLLHSYRDKRMSDARKDLEKSSTIVLGKEVKDSGFILIDAQKKFGICSTSSRRAAAMSARYSVSPTSVTRSACARYF